VSTSNV